MKTDRELLELAAQAIGEKFHSGHMTVGGKEFEWVEWDPLTDDGDALRLAMALCRASGWDLSLELSRTGARVNESVERNSSDQGSATRRAIVRAAADLGETKVAKCINSKRGGAHCVNFCESDRCAVTVAEAGS